MNEENKILVVDDNPINIEIFRKLLAGRYVLRDASSGEQALEILDEFKPDIILLDIMMSGIDGYEVCRRIRRDETLKYTKIIMVSAKAMISERLKGYEVGADDYITKPFEKEELLAKIRVYLRLKSAEEVEQGLRQLNRELTEYNRLQRDFVITVSHELRTPLTIFKNVISNALAGTMGTISSKLRQNLEMADRTINRLARIVSNFLDVSSLESGSVSLNRSLFDLAGLIREVIENMTPIAQTRNIELLLESDSSSVNLQADEEKIRQVVSNLVGNAIKFSPPKNGKVHIRLTCDSSQATCEITDNGPGIPHEDLERIFSRFVQRQIHVGPGDHGTGLGLSIARDLVHLHEGEIWAQSDESKGSSFFFRLPRGLDRPEPSQEPCISKMEHRYEPFPEID